MSEAALRVWWNSPELCQSNHGCSYKLVSVIWIATLLNTASRAWSQKPILSRGFHGRGFYSVELERGCGEECCAEAVQRHSSVVLVPSLSSLPCRLAPSQLGQSAVGQGGYGWGLVMGHSHILSWEAVVGSGETRSLLEISQCLLSQVSLP